MDDLIKYGPPIVGLGVSLVALVAWFIRLESAGKANREALAAFKADQQEAISKVRAELEAVRREQAEINKRAQDQAIMLARIDESLSSIKITLDRLYERTASGKA